MPTSTLRIDLRGDRAYGLVVALEVDGVPILEREGQYAALPADEILGTGALLPTDPPRRVALTECGCGGGVGCSNVSVVISERDGLISWSEPANVFEYAGALPEPEADLDPFDDEGYTLTPVDVPEVSFDALAYRAEVARANADERWLRRLARRRG